MTTDYTNDYLLDKKIKIFQPTDGYRASSDAVILSSAACKIPPDERVLDLGSGTGAISLCLAHRFPSAKIDGFELQSALVELSNMSAKANGFENLHFYQQDLRCPNTAWYGQYHHVITNPPYTGHDMPSPNTSKATAHNFQNFSLTAWLTLALKCLRPQGYLYTINRAEAIDEILSVLHGKTGEIKLVSLLSKQGQKAKRILVCARKSSHTPTVICPQLIIHDDKGNYTEKAQKILRAGMGMFD